MTAQTIDPTRSDAESRRWFRFAPDARDLLAIAILYVLVVGANRLAFTGFTTAHEIALFIAFGVVGLLLLGVTAPVVYSVWLRHRPLDVLGVGRHRWKRSLVLGVAFAAIQFTVTLAGYRLPVAQDWVPLLLMSVVVGLFEALFFRGFIQNRLEASFGLIPGLLGAAVLYGLYHVGYGMGGRQIVFLLGLGIVYAALFRLTGNILILWPLLTPLGAFFNNLQSGDIRLPWVSMVGFGEVLLAMGVVLWFAYRHGRQVRNAATASAGLNPPPPKQGDWAA